MRCQRIFLYFYLIKLTKISCFALQFLRKYFAAIAASRLATSGAVARVTRVAVFRGFKTALFLRGLSPANECAS